MRKSIEEHTQEFLWFQFTERVLRETVDDVPPVSESGALVLDDDIVNDLDLALSWSFPVLDDDRLERIKQLMDMMLDSTSTSHGGWSAIQREAQAILDEYEWPPSDELEAYLLVHYWANQD